MILFLLLFIILPHVSHAADDPAAWTTLDTALQIAFTAVAVMDWRQTRDIHNHPAAHEENRYLGAAPDARKINTYFTVMIVGHAAASYYMPKPWRTVWQAVWIGTEWETVRWNRSMGLKIAF